MPKSGIFVGAVLAVTVFFVVPEAFGLIVATTADDVCFATADPCNITDEVRIQPGSVLDFGVRTVRVTGADKLKFGSTSATLRCGDLDIDVSGTGIKIKESIAGEVVGGGAFIVARRACSRDLTLPCLTDATCAAVSAGSCTAGPQGQVTVSGKVAGDGVFPGSFDVVIIAGMDITVSSDIDVSGTGEADGGTVDLQANRDINISGDILCKAVPPWAEISSWMPVVTLLFREAPGVTCCSYPRVQA